MFMNVASALVIFSIMMECTPENGRCVYSVGATKKSVFLWVQQTIREEEVKFC
jgi:hypothetical protein